MIIEISNNNLIDNTSLTNFNNVNFDKISFSIFDPSISNIKFYFNEFLVC